MINHRFPELENARSQFLGEEPARSPLKNLHVGELEKFSSVVYNLAKEEEPFNPK